MRPIRIAVLVLVLALCGLSSATLLTVAVIGPQRVARHLVGGAARWLASAATRTAGAPLAAIAPLAPLPAIAIDVPDAPDAPGGFAVVSSVPGRVAYTVSRHGYAYSSDSRRAPRDFSWAVVSGPDEVSMSDWNGWSQAWGDRAPRQRAFWFRQEGATWRVTDPALVAEADRALEETRALGAQQGRLGGEQGRLGGEQGRLGGRMGELGGRLAAIAARQAVDDDGSERLTRDVERELRELEARMRALSARQSALGARQNELGARQSAASARAERVLREIAARARQLGKAERMGDDV